MSNLANSPNSGEISGSPGGLINRGDNSDLQHTNHHQPAMSTTSSGGQQQPAATKRKRNLPGTPDPDAEVIALSPRALLATNRFVCEICNKGFQRDQNLQLHRRGHNLPWKLRQRPGGKDAPQRKRVYVCPETSCVHHHPSRALGDLTGIKKHFSRKHGEKKWKCDKCSKRYAVQSDWKAHLKTCGTREYRCDCGTLFSRRDSFITHRAFCDALAEESSRVTTHRQGDQSGGGPDNGPSGGTATAAIGAPSSPHGTNSQLSGGPTDVVPSFSEVSKPSMPDSMSDFPLTESGIASLSSKWVHGASSSAGPSKGSGLSLWLGTGPGPGPPGAVPTMKLGGLMMQSSRGMNEVGNAGGTGSSEVYTDAMHPHKLPNGVVPLSTSGSAGGMLANLFASGNNGYSGSQGSGVGGGQNASNAMAGMSSFAGVMNHLDRGRFGSSFGSMPSTSSLFNQQQHTATAQFSATALLQKAAQMGATASNTSLFRGFGMGSRDSTSMARGGEAASARQGTRQDQGRAGINSIFSSAAMPSYPMMRQAGDHSSNSQGTKNSLLGSSSILGQGRSNEGSGVQEFINSLSGGAGVFGGGLGNPSSLLGSSNNGHGKAYMQQHADSLLKHHMMGEKAQDSQTSMLHGRSHFQLGTLRGSGSLGGPESGEDGGGKTTHDFLGVGGISGMAGATTGMGRTLSQKDLASITSLNSGVCREPFPYQHNNLKTLGSRGQSPPGQSWDSS